MKLIFTGCSSKRTCFNVLDPDRVFQLNLDRSNGTISFALIEAELLQSKIWRLAKKRSGDPWGNGNFNRNDGVTPLLKQAQVTRATKSRLTFLS